VRVSNPQSALLVRCTPGHTFLVELAHVGRGTVLVLPAFWSLFAYTHAIFISGTAVPGLAGLCKLTTIIAVVSSWMTGVVVRTIFISSTDDTSVEMAEVGVRSGCPEQKVAHLGIVVIAGRRVHTTPRP